MNEKTEIAKISADLLIALIQDKSGALNRLEREAKLPTNASVLAIYDVIHAHLSRTVTAQ